jgi:hypothetical protein
MRSWRPQSGRKRLLLTSTATIARSPLRSNGVGESLDRAPLAQRTKHAYSQHVGAYGAWLTERQDGAKALKDPQVRGLRGPGLQAAPEGRKGLEALVGQPRARGRGSLQPLPRARPGAAPSERHAAALRVRFISASTAVAVRAIGPPTRPWASQSALRVPLGRGGSAGFARSVGTRPARAPAT